MGATYNYNAFIKLDGLAVNVSKLIYIDTVPEGAANTVTPAVAVEGNESKDPVDIDRATKQSGGVYYYNRMQDPTLTEKAAFGKAIVNIAGTDTSNMDGPFGAFTDNMVVYEIGSGFANKQAGALATLVFEDSGFNTDYLQPQTLTLGKYTSGDGLTTASLKVRVTYSDLIADYVYPTYVVTDLEAGGITLQIPAVNKDKITSIRYEFTNVDSGFSVATAPTISFKVMDPSVTTNKGTTKDYQNIRMDNTAKMTYTYDVPSGDVYTSTPKSETASVFFKAFSDNLQERNERNKEVNNLSNPGKYPVKGDILLFTATVDNTDGADQIPLQYITDTYSVNMKPYSGTSNVPTANRSTLPSNVVLWVQNPEWEGEGDEEHPEYIKATDQAAIKSVTSADGQLVLKFYTTADEDEYIIPKGSSIQITYTLEVTEDSDTFVNQFTAAGGWYWGNGNVWWNGHVAAKNKVVSNITKGISPASQPIQGDVLIFEVTLVNGTHLDMTEMVVNDAYTKGVMQEYTGALTALNTDHSLYEHLIAGNKYSMGLHIDSADIDYITNNDLVVTDKGDGSFTVAFKKDGTGANIGLKSGDSIKLVYVMQVADAAKGGDVIRNTFTFDGILFGETEEKTLSEGLCETVVDPNATKLGYVHVVKNAKGVQNSEGAKPDTKNLVNGDRIRYTIDVGNYHTRLGKTVHVKNIIDTLPKNLRLDDSSIKLIAYELDADGNRITDKDADIAFSEVIVQPTEATPTTTMTINFVAAHALVSGLVKDTTAKYRLELVYECVVDTQSEVFGPVVDTPATALERKNSANVFFTEELEELYVQTPANGGKVDATTDGGLDVDAATKSYVPVSSTVQVYNEKKMSVGIKKEVDTPTIDLASGITSRTYTVTIENHSLADLNLSYIVDLLPKYETLDTTKDIKIILTKPDGTDGGTYTLTYEVLSDFAEAGETEKRIKFTGYNGQTGIVIPKAGRKVENEIATILQYKAVLTYSTVVDTTTALTDFRQKSNSFESYKNYVALYTADASVDLTMRTDNGSNGAKRTIDGVEATDWDSNVDTAVNYYATRVVILSAASTSPYIGLIPNTILENNGKETYSKYDPKKSTINPGEIMAWDVAFGNDSHSGFDIATLNDGMKIVLVMPKGMEFIGFELQENITIEKIPTYLANGGIPEYISTATQNIYVWSLESGTTYAEGQGASFKIRTSTETNNYTSYAPIAYTVPTAEETQYFYRSIVVAGSNSNFYNYSDVEEWRNMSSYLNDASATNMHVVRTSAAVDVFGDLGVRGQFNVTANSNTISSGGSTRTLKLGEREDIFTYTMQVIVDKAAKGFDNTVMISRLASVDDTHVLTDHGRESQANARLVGDGSFSASVTSLTNSVEDSNFDVDKWTIEYFFGAVNETFTDADWTDTVSARWLSADDVSAQGQDFAKATAVRVRVLDEYQIPVGYELKVTYQAELPNYVIGQQIAWGSFGYRGSVNNHEIAAEPLSLGVYADVNFDRAKITKTLVDGKETPKQTTFDMTLVGTSTKSEPEVTRNVTLTVEKNANGVWEAVGYEYDLPFDYTWEVQEIAPANYKEPVITLNKVNNTDKTVTWEFSVVNEPIVYTVTYHANGGTGSQTDAASPYYAKDVATTLSQGSMARTNYTFTGWNTAANGSGTSYGVGANIQVTGNVVLYAQWNLNPTPSPSPSPSPSVTPSPSPSPSTSPSVSPSPSPTESETPSPSPSPSPGPDLSEFSPEDQEKIQNQTGNIFTDIINGNVPTGNLTIKGAWSVLSLLMSLTAAMIALITFITMFTSKRKDDEEDEAYDEEEARKRRSKLLKAGVAIIGLLVGIIWLILDNLKLPIVYINKWTIYVAIAFLATIVMLVVQLVVKKKDKDEDEEDRQHAN